MPRLGRGRRGGALTLTGTELHSDKCLHAGHDLTIFYADSVPSRIAPRVVRAWHLQVRAKRYASAPRAAADAVACCRRLRLDALLVRSAPHAHASVGIDIILVVSHIDPVQLPTVGSTVLAVALGAHTHGRQAALGAQCVRHLHALGPSALKTKAQGKGQRPASATTAVTTAAAAAVTIARALPGSVAVAVVLIGGARTFVGTVEHKRWAAAPTGIIAAGWHPARFEQRSQSLAIIARAGAAHKRRHADVLVALRPRIASARSSGDTRRARRSPTLFPAAGPVPRGH
eukprot:scaffold635_cov535-Prasinococcus_capsulatus_cf.AAC.13